MGNGERGNGGSVVCDPVPIFCLPCNPPVSCYICYMTIEQTVDIPADHRVFFEFLAPREIPAGKARVEVKVTPVVEKQTDQKSEPTLKSADEGEISHVDALLAILSQIGGTIDIDELRTERILAKHSKHLP